MTQVEIVTSFVRSTRALFEAFTIADHQNISPYGESPNTKGDQKIADYLTNKLSEHYPDDQIIVEDNPGLKIKNAPATWVVDPIDGTIPFMYHIPSYMVSLYRVVKYKVVLAIAYDPVQDLLYVSEPPSVSTCNGGVMHVSESDKIQGARIAISDHALSTLPWLYSELKQQGAFVFVQEGLVCRSMLVASGHIDATIQPTLRQFESGTVRSIVEQAGGIVRTFQDRPIHLDNTNSNVIISNSALYPELHKLLFNNTAIS